MHRAAVAWTFHDHHTPHHRSLLKVSFREVFFFLIFFHSHFILVTPISITPAGSTAMETVSSLPSHPFLAIYCVISCFGPRKLKKVKISNCPNSPQLLSLLGSFELRSSVVSVLPRVISGTTVFLRCLNITLIFGQRGELWIYSGRPTGSLGIAVPPSVSPICTQFVCLSF